MVYMNMVFRSRKSGVRLYLLLLYVFDYNATKMSCLNFKNRASYIWDGRTSTLQMLHFIYFFNKYKY